MKHLLSLLFICISFCSYSQKEVSSENINGLVFKNLFDASNNDSVSCYRIPALITAPNGDLIAAIDERVPSCGDLKWSNDINIVMRRSKDNGKTWSTPTDITSQITKKEWHKDFKFITSGRGIQTKSGKLIHTLVNLKNGMHLFGSDNHGKSWYLIDTPIVPADESKIIELADGTWMVNSRVNTDKFRYVHTSKNQGKTWTSKPAKKMIDARCNASILRYSSTKKGATKNRILFSNANSTQGRKNLTIKISYDEGKTWSVGKTIYTGSSAYSSLTILKNGEIGVFFEKDGYKKNVFTSFTLDWLTDGKDSL